ncbi:MAG: amidohydrolase [Solobacterium sp.]|nr:amidohydrolase [Solobacterium sp.]
MTDIHELARKYEDYMIAIRRHFHMHPELSLQEEQTSARIQEELKEMGIPFEVVGHRNVVGRTDFGKPGKRLAIRADIDALPMQEEIDSEFKSVVPGVMHACGHDVHAATLLAAAKCFTEMKDELSGTLFLCFQVAEEISGGGPQEIIEYLNGQGGVDEVIANHMTPALDPYVTSVTSGPANAGNCQWRITVRGRGGHGSRPDLSIDPIRPAAEILQKITSIPSNYHAPFLPLVISPCMIHSGTAYNIIPDECVMEGNIRYFRKGELEEVLEQMQKIASAIASASGAEARVEMIAGCVPVENTPEVTEKVVHLMEEMGLKVERPEFPGMGSDDFGYFTQAYPGCYFNFGASSDRPDAAHNLHNTKLFYEEKGFLPIVEFFVRYAADFLK